MTGYPCAEVSMSASRSPSDDARVELGNRVAARLVAICRTGDSLVVRERMRRLFVLRRYRHPRESLEICECRVAPPPRLALLDRQEARHVGEALGVHGRLHGRPELL